MTQTFVDYAAEQNKVYKGGKRTALVIGGSDGIGAGSAEVFDRMGFKTIVAARRDRHPNKNIEFRKVDLSLLAEVKKFTDEFKKDYSHVKDLILVNTAGGLANGTMEATSEGIQKAFAVQCLGRYFTARELAPLIGTQGSVVWVGSPGGGQLDLDDLQCLQPPKSRLLPKFIQQIQRDGAFFDAATYLLTDDQHLKVSHIFPGIVATDVIKNSNQPWVLQKFFQYAGPWLGYSVAQYAEVPAFTGWNLEWFPEGEETWPRFANDKGKPLAPSAFAKEASNRSALKSQVEGLWNRVNG